MTGFSTTHIQYLEREYLDGLQGRLEEESLHFFVPDISSIKLVKVLGISQPRKHIKEIVSSRHLMEDITAGFYGENLSLIYIIIGEPSKIHVFLGTFQLKNGSTNPQQLSSEPLSMVKPSLESAYPGIDIVEQKGDNFDLQEMLEVLNFAGIVTGTPTIKAGTEEGVEQIERLIRGLYGTMWGYMVVATPVDEQDVHDLYNSALHELRIMRDTERSAGIKSPIAEKYNELLDIFLKKVEVGKTQGMWHTAAYFLSQDGETFNRAKAILKSVFGGERSRPDPVRVLSCHNLAENIHQFAQITTAAPPSPGRIQYPFKYLSTLNSKELTSLIHFPAEEMPGYFVKDYARFDVASHYTGGDTIDIGEVIDQGRRMGCTYKVELNRFDRHGLIVGTTGSGKTNTIFHLLRQIWQKGIPFMVVEPAKTEYRKLLQSELGEHLHIFTLGDDTTSPFRLNPLEIMPGVSVQTHIDHLKSVFNASFILYAPMPYVLERCIHEVYQDKGWDLVTSENERGYHKNAQPTLTDLYRKIDTVVDRLGYEAKITMDVKAALKTRINSLRIGGKGLMLDTRKSIPIEKLIQGPTVLELEQIGDDDEKAFVTGLLLMYLYEYYVSRGLQEGVHLNHITVVEEAHRLFKNVPSIVDTEVANIKGKAVETFCNILSEIRAYGEGVLIAEQIPSKLAPDIVKNTNLKIMHRTVAEDDRMIMGGTMNLEDDEECYIASLHVGEAAVYSEGDDRSLLMKVPYSKIESCGLNKIEENHLICKTMKGFAEEMNDVFVPLESCLLYCKAKCRYKKEAMHIVEDPEFNEVLSRYILSVIVHDAAVAEEFPQLIQSINRRRKCEDFGLVLCTLINGIDYYFESRGQQYGWKYEDVELLKKDFTAIVSEFSMYTEESQPQISDKVGRRIESARKTYTKLCRREYPFFSCKDICSDNLCLYRYNTRSLLDNTYIDKKFTKAFHEKGNIKWEKFVKVVELATRRIVSQRVDAEVKRRVGLCFVLQKAQSKPYLDVYDQDIFINKMLMLLNRRWG